MRRSPVAIATIAFVVGSAAACGVGGAVPELDALPPDVPHEFLVRDLDDDDDDLFEFDERDAVASTGALILGVMPDLLHVEALPREAAAIARLGFRLELHEPAAPKTTEGPVLDAPAATPDARVPSTSAQPLTGAEYPAEDSGFHTYAEMVNAIQNIQAASPDRVAVTTFGTGTYCKQVTGSADCVSGGFQNDYVSDEHAGHDLWLVKVSDNVGVDEDEPEVLFSCNIHARERLTIEMCLYALRMLTQGYGVEQRITNVVDGREIWLAMSYNPDGAEYDIYGQTYKSWRKTRHFPPAGSSCVGIDGNRNWGYKWGGSGSSADPCSQTYRGTAAFSSPEVQALATFVGSRVVGGKQQIKTHIDFHTYSELVLWPYGYTTADLGDANEMSADDHGVFKTAGEYMASKNGYKPQQASDLYLSAGIINDWMYSGDANGDGAPEKIFSYTFEMYPPACNAVCKPGHPGFYPDDEVIAQETSRNKDPVLYVAEIADCPYRVIGKESTYCSTSAQVCGDGIVEGTEQCETDAHCGTGSKCTSCTCGSCKATGATCSSGSECCSGTCSGKGNKKTCG